MLIREGIGQGKKVLFFLLQKPSFKFGNVIVLFLCLSVKEGGLTTNRKAMKKKKNLNKEVAG
jgi:hypothetical protein